MYMKEGSKINILQVDQIIEHYGNTKNDATT